MGLLGQLISNEFDKKKQERQLQMEAYANLLQSGKVKPGQEMIAWDQFKKAAPKEGHGVLEMMKPLFMGRHKQAAGGGTTDTDDPGAPGQGAPAAKQGKPDKQTKQATAPGGSPFFTDEEIAAKKEAADKQADARAVEQATRLETAKATVKRQSELQNRKDDFEQIETITKDANKTEEQKQLEISQITGRAPSERTWKSGVVMLPNGSALPVSFSDKDPSKVMLGGGQVVAVPPGSSPPRSWEDYDREQAEKRREEHEKATENKPPPDSAEVRERTEFHESKGMPHDAAHKQALDDLYGAKGEKTVREELNVTRLGKALQDKKKAEEPSAENTGSWDAAAFVSLLGGPKPTFGLGKSGDRDAFNRAQRGIESRIGPLGVMKLRGQVKASTGEMYQLAKQAGVVDALESAFQYDIKNAKDTSANVGRTVSRKFNSGKQFLEANITDDPELARFQVAVQTAVNQYSRIMVLGGRGSDQTRQHAEALLSAAMPDGAFNAALDQLNTEAGNMMEGLNAAQEHATGAIERLGQPLPAATSGPKAGTVENGYRFKGGDPAKQENWEPVK